MRSSLGDKIRLQHILDAIIEIENYTVNTQLFELEDNSMMRFACVKQLEIIGESCNHISPGTKEKYSDIEWSQIVGMRNVFVHEYFGIDTKIIWDIITNDLPKLKISLKEVLSSFK